MAPKRKSDAAELDTQANVASGTQFVEYHDPETGFKASVLDLTEPPATKKARVTSEAKASGSSSKKSTKENATTSGKLQNWRDIKLEGEGQDGGVPVYDTCAEIRRKIHLLQKTPGWKVTHWLQEIGNVNSNSYGRFMKEKDKMGGAGNGTYYCAYVYFEKIRILEGKKKTATRKGNEGSVPNGFLLESPSRSAWVTGPA